MTKPVITWAGGKRHMLDEIRVRLPNEAQYGRFFEPFFGGGAVFFDLEPENAYLSDINPRLINFYQILTTQSERIIQENIELDRELDEANEEERKRIYVEYRHEFNKIRDSTNEKHEEVNTKRQKSPQLLTKEELNWDERIREAVLFFFLNRTCWNGLYRTNKQGEFNVPMGRNWTRTESLKQRVRAAVPVLSNAKIFTSDFKDVIPDIQENDLVFFDPPYPPVSETSNFRDYHHDGFGMERQRELKNVAQELNDSVGAQVLITNANTPEIIDLYTEDDISESYRIRKIRGERRINEDPNKRTNLGYTDVIITNISVFGSDDARQGLLEDFRN